LSADNGLNIVEFLKTQINIRTVGSLDGLAGNECNQGAYYKDSQGYLWFGTVNGVSRYDPSLDKANVHAPKILFTHIQVYDRDVAIHDTKTSDVYGYDENYFKFEFIGLDLLAPHKVVYKYRLNGVDEHWLNTSRPYVQYAGLADDHYSFQVMAANEWGYWSEPRTYSFIINPPYWKTWWFALFAFFLIVSPVIVVIRQRINRLLAVERLRAKIAADLHDDIGAGLSEISILSAVVAAKASPEVIKNFERELSKIGFTARSLIDKMSDIVWLVNPKKDAVSDLVIRLSDSFADIFKAKGIQFHCENEDVLRPIRLEMEYRQNLFLILKEAIHNALKYSLANELVLSVSLSGRELTLRLTDNGQGFEPDKATGGNGLKNMNERARKIKGQVTIYSKKSEGTVIEFRGVIK